MKLHIYFISANLAYNVEEMTDELNTDLDGNPRVYVSSFPSGKEAITGWEDYDYFINNAKIIDANHQSISDNGDKQVSPILSSHRGLFKKKTCIVVLAY